MSTDPSFADWIADEIRRQFRWLETEFAYLHAGSDLEAQYVLTQYAAAGKTTVWVLIEPSRRYIDVRLSSPGEGSFDAAIDANAVLALAGVPTASSKLGGVDPAAVAVALENHSRALRRGAEQVFAGGEELIDRARQVLAAAAERDA
jgi:hypothetical protein